MGTVGSNTDFLPAHLSYLCYFAYSNSRSCHRSSSSALALFLRASRRTMLPYAKTSRSGLRVRRLCRNMALIRQLQEFLITVIDLAKQKPFRMYERCS